MLTWEETIVQSQIEARRDRIETQKRECSANKVIVFIAKVVCIVLIAASVGAAFVYYLAETLPDPQ